MYFLFTYSPKFIPEGICFCIDIFSSCDITTFSSCLRINRYINSVKENGRQNVYFVSTSRRNESTLMKWYESNEIIGSEKQVAVFIITDKDRGPVWEMQRAQNSNFMTILLWGNEGALHGIWTWIKSSISYRHTIALSSRSAWGSSYARATRTTLQTRRFPQSSPQRRTCRWGWNDGTSWTTRLRGRSMHSYFPSCPRRSRTLKTCCCDDNWGSLQRFHCNSRRIHGTCVRKKIK